ncbi:hypothetical protein CRG98_034978 [Punica granatum]|uniref:Uncharacterized protein n=1 Tax=Punica granatum TaxID=22663 RepID=A0A2I0ILK0_PUNGR|nr:hypothetical protein CRG98_034978 [Punica granatum]
METHWRTGWQRRIPVIRNCSRWLNLLGAAPRFNCVPPFPVITITACKRFLEDLLPETIAEAAEAAETGDEGDPIAKASDEDGDGREGEAKMEGLIRSLRPLEWEPKYTLDGGGLCAC